MYCRMIGVRPEDSGSTYVHVESTVPRYDHGIRAVMLEVAL